MLPADFKVVDLGGDNWSRVISLATGLSPLPARDGAKGPLLVVHRGLKLLKAIDVGRWREVRVEFTGTSRLDALARESGYQRVVAVEERALARITASVQREVYYRDDFFRQAAAYARAFAGEWGRSVVAWPPRPRRIPVVPYPVIDALIRLAIPGNSLVLLTVTDGGVAWCSLVLGYRHGDFWLLSSLDTLGEEYPDLKGTLFRSAAGRLAERFGGTVRAVCIERSALERISASRLKMGALLWAFNTSELRLLGVPLRWKVATLLASLLSSIRPRSNS